MFPEAGSEPENMDRTNGFLKQNFLERFTSPAGFMLRQIVQEGSIETDNRWASNVTRWELRFATLTLLKGLKKHEALVQMLSFLYQMIVT